MRRRYYSQTFFKKIKIELISESIFLSFIQLALKRKASYKAFLKDKRKSRTSLPVPGSFSA